MRACATGAGAAARLSRRRACENDVDRTPLSDRRRPVQIYYVVEVKIVGGTIRNHGSAGSLGVRHAILGGRRLLGLFRRLILTSRLGLLSLPHRVLYVGIARFRPG